MAEILIGLLTYFWGMIFNTFLEADLFRVFQKWILK